MHMHNMHMHRHDAHAHAYARCTMHRPMSPAYSSPEWRAALELVFSGCTLALTLILALTPSPNP